MVRYVEIMCKTSPMFQSEHNHSKIIPGRSSNVVQCSNWNIGGELEASKSIPWRCGSEVNLVFPLEHLARFSGRMFQLERSLKCSGWNSRLIWDIDTL